MYSRFRGEWRGEELSERTGVLLGYNRSPCNGGHRGAWWGSDCQNKAGGSGRGIRVHILDVNPRTELKRAVLFFWPPSFVATPTPAVTARTLGRRAPGGGKGKYVHDKTRQRASTITRARSSARTSSSKRRCREAREDDDHAGGVSRGD